MTNPVDSMIADVVAGKAKAKAEGYEPPSGTYTFTNKEGACVLAALSVVIGLIDGRMDKAYVMASILEKRKEEALAILQGVADKIAETQAPPYIKEAVDKAIARAKTERETNRNLS